MRSDANGFLFGMTGFLAKATSLIERLHNFNMGWPNAYADAADGVGSGLKINAGRAQAAGQWHRMLQHKPRL
jgi:hypothetical protein